MKRLKYFEFDLVDSKLVGQFIEMGMNMDKIERVKKISISLFRLSLVLLGIMNITLNLRKFSSFEFVKKKYKGVVEEDELKLMEIYDCN